MHDPSRKQGIKGVLKPSGLRRSSVRISRHVRFDAITDQTLFHAISILNSSDKVSIGLVIRRALHHYDAMLLKADQEWIEAERVRVRQGARIAKSVGKEGQV